MRIYNRYIITVAILLLLTTVILVALSIDTLEIYYISYVIETLIVSELYYKYFNTQARRKLNMISLALLGGFLVIVVIHIIKLLT